jgi:hypothetical protein
MLRRHAHVSDPDPKTNPDPEWENQPKKRRKIKSEDQKKYDNLCDLLENANTNTIIIGNFNWPGIRWDQGLADD